MSFYELCGITAGVIAFAAYPVYIRDILKRGTRPNRATWWILTLSSTILVASYYASGARSTLWIALGYAVGNLTIAFFSLRYGDGTWNTLDRICLLAAVGSVFLWIFFDAPFYALVINIGIDFLGILPTVYKTYAKPSTESHTAWLMDAVASMFAVLAIEQWTMILALYPVYLLIANCSIAGLSLRTKRRMRHRSKKR